jgi:hypothetical protein
MCSNSELCYDCISKKHKGLVMEVRRQAIVAGISVFVMLLLVVPINVQASRHNSDNSTAPSGPLSRQPYR